MKKKLRVAVGMSGGVDSSVAAALLIEKGYEVHGAYLECYNEPGCRTDQDKADALKVAMQLGCRFLTLDLRKKYKEKVVQYFLAEYRAGRTPNPDIVCNREVKFGILYDYARKNGFDYVATGHYARIVTLRVGPLKSNFKGETLIARARDLTKDQSYFLWQVPQDHLNNILFPLGDMLKSEVRAKARELHLPVADKPDSMGVCMMGELDVGEFLRQKLGEKPGEVVMQCHGDTVTQCHIGTHRGLWFYTIGQRGGWERSSKSQIINSQRLKLGINTNNMPPLYVIGKDKANNQLIVGEREEAMRKEFWIDSSTTLGMTVDAGKLWVRVRNLGELVAVSKCHSVTGGMIVETVEPIFAVAEGQSAVFYDERGCVVGGGIIRE
ncbi:MAG: tRNA 2-thiouridine(34) synthase MnmA [bacterium]